MLFDQQPTIITGSPKSLRAYTRSLIGFSELIWILASQEIKNMYAQTYFGLLWAIIRPLFTLGVFTVIFRYFLHVQTAAPYYLFAFAGMIAWNYFSQIAISGSTAVVQKQMLVRKMYFPKLILPLSKVIVCSIEAGISLIILLVMIIISGQHISLAILALPLFILLTALCGFTIAVWMNALNVRFRDLNQIVPAIIGMAIWVTPVFYPSTIVPSAYSVFVYSNPMAAVIKGYRYALLGEPFPEAPYWAGVGVIFLLCIWGISYFIGIENEIADTI